MFRTLTRRNARQSVKDYLIYVITLTITSTLMYAFHGMIFASDMRALYSEFAVFVALIAIASFFVMFIIMWLVHYMVNFMLEHRSREFGIYLLIGMTKKQITRIFCRENLLLGALALLLGIIPGFIFQKLFTNVFYNFLEIDYKIAAELDVYGVLVTVAVMLASYIIALLRVKRRFKKLQIADFINMEKESQKVVKESSHWQSALAILSLIYIILFNVMVVRSLMSAYTVWIYILGLIVAIYLLYVGLSPVFVRIIKKKSPQIYRGANLFVLRQLASKIKTMRFTMGTLSILFSAALLGWTLVIMFADYQRTELDLQIPYDVAIFSDNPQDEFKEELDVINNNATLVREYSYIIYHQNTDNVNRFLYEHVDGTSKNDVFVDGKFGTSTYYAHDTYMKLSDYNVARDYLGYEPVAFGKSEYIIHGKSKISELIDTIAQTIPIMIDGEKLTCREIRDEPFAQNSMNGADYIIIVSDDSVVGMESYYSVLIGELGGVVPDDLQNKLRDVKTYFDEESYENLYAIEVGKGSNQVITVSDYVIVSKNFKTEASFVVVTMCFILAYLGIIFLCTALTIMTVQQLSDASKYRFRYDVLKKLGMNKRAVHQIIFKQLAVYYLCPYIISIILSMFIGLFASERFVYHTGIDASNFQYYIYAVLVFTAVYAIYFAASFVGFVRNIEKNNG